MDRETRGGQNVCGGPLRHLKQLGFYSRFSGKPLNVQKSIAGDQYVFERTRGKEGKNVNSAGGVVFLYSKT